MSQFLQTHFSQAALRGSDPQRLTIDEGVSAKWNDAFEGEDTLKESIKDTQKRRTVTQMLEYQYQDMGGDLNENITMNIDEAGEGVAAASLANGGNANFDPVLIKMVRKIAPALIHHDLVGVQPMTGPTGLIFAMKSFYCDKDGKRAAEVNPLNQNAGSSGPVADSIHVGHTAGKYDADLTDKMSDRSQSMYSATDIEQLGTKQHTSNAGLNDVQIDAARIWPEMTFKIEKQNVGAEARALKARYTDELVQDLKAVHGLNARDELANILSTEIVSEQNRELIMLLAEQAKVGCQNTAVKGTFNLDVDADGRWAVEKLKGLLMQINREAHIIALETRRGVGNTLIAHSDIVAALDMAGVVDKNIVTGNMNIDGIGVTFAGTLSGRFRVFVDPYASTYFILIGFKGATQYDAGFFYCPYVALQFMEARDSESFQPNIGVKTRYGMCVNPLVGDNNHSGGAQALVNTKAKNPYYRIFLVTGL